MAERIFHAITKDVEDQFMIYNMHGECINSEFRPKPLKNVRILFVSDHLHNRGHRAKFTSHFLNNISVHNSNAIITHYATNKETQLKLNVPIKYTKNTTVILKDPSMDPVEDLKKTIQLMRPHVVIVYQADSELKNTLDILLKYRMTEGDDAPLVRFNMWAIFDTYKPSFSAEEVETFNQLENLFTYTEEWKKNLVNSGVTINVSTIVPGVDTNIFAGRDKISTRNILRISQNEFIVLSANKNRENKRYDILIKAFVKFMIRHLDNNIVLSCICESGEERGWCLGDLFMYELQKVGLDIAKYTNRLRVAYQPSMFTNEEMNMFYGSADVAISVADNEKYNTFALETMAVGIPNVLTRIPGNIVTNTDETAIFVEAGDIDGAADALDKLYLNEELRETMRAAGFKRGREITWDVGCINLLEQIDTVEVK